MQNKLQFRKVSKHFKDDVHSVRHVCNNDLNSACHSLHGAHHRSTNFEKPKMCKRNCNFEKFQNSINVIYTVRHIRNNALKSFCHSLHGAHHSTTNVEKATMCKTNCNFQKFQNTLNMMYTVCAMSEKMI